MSKYSGEEKCIGILTGGDSKEKEISRKSAAEILVNMPEEFSNRKIIEINKAEEVLEKCKNLDMVFIALHGGSGENGEVQRLLGSIGVNYTGTGVQGSRVCMDKMATKELLRMHNVGVPRGIRLSSNDDELGTRCKMKHYGWSFPVILKPISEGSSIGVKLAWNYQEVKATLRENKDIDYMMEEYIDGEEITVSILNGRVLPPLCVSGFGEVLDFSSKYETGNKKVSLLEKNHVNYGEISDAALRCWDILGLSVYGRIDMIVKKGKVYVLEINTLPGMTEKSFFPMSAKAEGISYGELLRKIILFSYSIDRGY